MCLYAFEIIENFGKPSLMKKFSDFPIDRGLN